ncbi:GerMN domain-containing protein [Neobacillus sp. LXY-4]|uniref:GerMN domain-containing protein n=1 Tax=Neobacillus sp. LXY-4 TaxID=3379826 RepID=UPI003EDFFEF4
MKKVSAFLAVVFLFGILVGCSMNNGNNSVDDNNNKNNNNNSSNNGSNNNNENEKPKPELLTIENYYPIKKNARYIYEGAGNEFASFDIYTDYVSGTKFQQRINNGGSVLARVLELKDGKLIKVYSRGEAYYRENHLNTADDNQEILLMEPIKKGTTWTLKDSRVRTITATSVAISTPTGNYQALEVTTESDNDKTIDYYAKNIGLVKSVFISGGNEITSTLSKIEENVPLIQNINFYYPNINDGKIYYKSKPVSFYTNDITRKVVAEAYKQAANNQVGIVFSANTMINSLYLNKDQHVYIDLNQKFIDEMVAGAGYEGMILQSIANTFGQYYNSERVYITIDNKLYESGHISMKKGEYLKVQFENTVELK